MRLEIRDNIYNKIENLENVRYYKVTDREIMVWIVGEPRPKKYDCNLFTIIGGTR